MALFLGNSTYLSLEIMRGFCAILNTGPHSRQNMPEE
jgi:hypothetical protein